MGTRMALVGVVSALFAAMLAYKLLHAGGLEQTALFYVGVPAIIAITVVLVAKPRSALGLVMAVITVGLALSGPLLGEGIVCLVFAAPLFYLVGAIFGAFTDYLRAEGPKGPQMLAAPLLLLAVIEGSGEVTSLPREEVVSASAAATGDVAAALAAPPRFAPYASTLLRLGFPRPLSASGTGLAVGATREIVFTPRRSLGIGARPEPRSMTLRVKESGHGRVVFEVVRDTTLARWLDLREAAFTWTGGRLTVALGYRRTFDPSWYFGPIQRYAATEAAGYLAATFAGAR
ncbi:hypothetical protein ACIBEJ_50220 [Nonomuraea sp. NPDC050790]|uniref:hypothetical protein n=1 Tax=Nonomuraea sp. NPDC050790 TaxID=3364371 RepID=UPI00379ECE4A